MSQLQGVNPGQFDAREAMQDLGEVHQPLDRAERLTLNSQRRMEDGVSTCVEIIDDTWPPVSEATATRIVGYAREASDQAQQRQFEADQRQEVDQHAASRDTMMQNNSGLADLYEADVPSGPQDEYNAHMNNMRATIDEIYRNQGNTEYSDN